MTGINWGMVYPQPQQNALSGVMQGMQFGRAVAQEREQREARNALAEYAVNPSEAGLAGIAAHAPEFAMQERQRYQSQAAAAQQQQQDQLPIVSRLLNGATAENWQQRLAMAQQYGIDISRVPQQFDPAWVSQTQTLVQAMQEPGGVEALSTAGRQAMDMGYEPGTPQFADVVTQIVTAGLAEPYTGSQGETRLYQPQLRPPQQAQTNAVPPPPNLGNAVDFEAYRGRVATLGAQEAAGWLQRSGFAIRVQSPDQARQLPSGTPIILPDGSEGRVP